MKIMQIIPTLEVGGAEIMCENLSLGLLKSGQSVTIVSLYNCHSPITKRMGSRGQKIIFLDKKKGIDTSLIGKLRKVLLEEKPDIIHSHLYSLKYVIWASSGLGIKRIHTLHSIANQESNFLNRKLNGLFFSLDKVIPVALSEIIQNTIITEYHIPKEKIPIIYNGVDFKNCLLKTDYSFKNCIQIIHVGRFSDPKNHIEILKAILKLQYSIPNIRLSIIGDGELRYTIQHFISSNKMEGYVSMIGIVDNVFPYLQKSDIFILPSKYEGMPMALIEAMGTGLPVVASNVGGIPNMIIDRFSGLICEPECEDIYRKILAYINDQKLREECGRNALIAVQQYSARTMLHSYLDLYNASSNSIDHSLGSV